MIPKSEAIVLKSFDYRETSRIATFFTKDYGKISGVMKGIRKDPRKFGSSVDKYSVNDLVYYHYSRSELHLISHCDMKQFYFLIRDDYKKNLAANYILELVDKIMQPEQANENVYRLMLRFLDQLQQDSDIDKLIHIFQIKVLRFSGFSPHLDSCVACGRRVSGRVRFSSISGGLICSTCQTDETHYMFISPGTISTIQHIEAGNWSACLRLGITAGVRKELKFILNNFLVYHLERKIKSAKYIS